MMGSHVPPLMHKDVHCDHGRLQTDQYIIRYRKSSAQAGFLVDAGSWIGFRYRDAHWSFVKQ
jgi:hypothetical protein